MLTKKGFENYRAMLARISEMASDKAKAVLRKYRKLLSAGLTEEEALEAIADALKGVMRSYGDMASSAAAAMYDKARADALPDANDGFAADLCDAAFYEMHDERIDRAVTGAVQAAAASASVAVEAAAAAPASKVVAVVETCVKGAARSTIEDNCKRDPKSKGFVSVPAGSTTCAWCTMQAGRGLIFKGKKERHYERWHDHCKCQPMPAWGKLPEWYDPAAYEEMYRQARLDWASGDYSDELHARLEKLDREKGRDHNKTDAIMSVMREKYGLK